MKKPIVVAVIPVRKNSQRLKNKNIVGRKSNFFFVSKIESSDIDDKTDFEMVKSIYPNFFLDEINLI